VVPNLFVPDPTAGPADGEAQDARIASVPGVVRFAAPRFVRGNVDSSEIVSTRPDLNDAFRLLQALYVSGDDVLPCREAGDVNDNGRLEITDAVLLLSHLFRSAQPPAAPYPEAGTDPRDSPADLGCELPVPYFAADS
jgi:hypothetical protein